MNTARVIAFFLVVVVAGVVQAQDRNGLKPSMDRRSTSLPGGLGAHTILLAEVPEEVIAAARQAAPGTAFTEALWYNADDWRVYRLEGGRYTERVVVDVRENGEVLSTAVDKR